MRGILMAALVLNLGLTVSMVEAGGGSGTRRTINSSDAIREYLNRRNGASARSRPSTTRRSQSATSRTTRQPATAPGQGSAAAQPLSTAEAEPRIRLRERIGQAVYAEMLKNGGRMPDRKRLEEISQAELKQAQEEGLIPADAKFDPAADFLEGTQSGISGGSLFGGATNPPSGGRGTKQSNMHIPSRTRQYLPSRSTQYLPSRSTIRRRGTGSSNGGLPDGLPDLSGGNAAGPSPDQLNQQLQRLLK